MQRGPDGKLWPDTGKYRNNPKITTSMDLYMQQGKYLIHPEHYKPTAVFLFLQNLDNINHQMLGLTISYSCDAFLISCQYLPCFDPVTFNFIKCQRSQPTWPHHWSVHHEGQGSHIQGEVFSSLSLRSSRGEKTLPHTPNFMCVWLDQNSLCLLQYLPLAGLADRHLTRKCVLTELHAYAKQRDSSTRSIGWCWLWRRSNLMMCAAASDSL